MLGIIILTIGVSFLLKNLGLISVSVWNIFWPLLLIVSGLALILKRRDPLGRRCYHRDRARKRFQEEIKE